MRTMRPSVALLVLISACTSDHTGSADDRVLNSGAGNRTGGTAGTATSSNAAAGSGFGNSDAMLKVLVHPPVDAGQLVGDGSDCVVGKFCASNNPDQGCGTITLESTIKKTMRPGNLLIIFDQSQSMSEDWMSTTKLQAARDSLVAAITPLQDSLHVGAIFLPDPNVSCIFEDPQMTPAVQPIEGTGNIPFQAGPMFLTAFNNHWSMQGAGKGVGTPLNEAFDRADVALQAATTALKNMTMSPVGDLAPGPLAVLVFTDGQPNCPPIAGGGGGPGGRMGASSPLPAVTGIPTKLEPDHAADWYAQGIPTYMVGLQGAMDGATLLNAIASSGSGGMMTMYISPQDPMALADKLKELAKLQVMSSFDSCSIDLTRVSPFFIVYAARPSAVAAG